MLGVSTWQRRFEDLRRQRNSEGRPNGIAVLIHRGIVAWMRTCPEEHTGGEELFGRELRAPQGTEPTGIDNGQIAGVFASMIFGLEQEVMA